MPPPQLSPIQSIRGVRLPNHPADSIWDVTVSQEHEHHRSTITSITPHQNPTPTSTSPIPPLLLPALTHPHIHLDKAYLHNALAYAHLLPSTGSFPEALHSTTHAKRHFHPSDVHQRGEWLLAESLAAGVTALRAFVEVDRTVDTVCLEAGIALKHKWKHACRVQLVCFAQDPIFSGADGDANRMLVERAIRKDEVEVVATTPYVEASVADAKRNVDWAIDQALRLDKHVDFHLDYHLDSSTEALVWYVLDALRRRGWTAASRSKKVMLGHCTRLTLFSEEEWRRLAATIKANDLPVSFVGLPTSDLYMAAPPPRHGGGDALHERPRGTLHVPRMIREYGLDAVMGVNNVGNAFTPWGSPDPLRLACLGVGVYQAGASKGAELLYECVSTRAREAIGLRRSRSCGGQGLAVREGDEADFVLLRNVDETGCEALRVRRSAAEVVWDPPSTWCRDVVSGGRLMRKPTLEQMVDNDILYSS